MIAPSPPIWPSSVSLAWKNGLVTLAGTSSIVTDGALVTDSCVAGVKRTTGTIISCSEMFFQRRRRSSVYATLTAIFCAQVVSLLSPRKVSRLSRTFKRAS